VAQLYPWALGSLSVASYNSQGLRWKYSNPPPHGGRSPQLSWYLYHCAGTIETGVVTHGNVLLRYHGLAVSWIPRYHGLEITSRFLDTDTCRLLLCGMFPQGDLYASVNMWT
jgi:hypothetical protein